MKRWIAAAAVGVSFSCAGVAWGQAIQNVVLRNSFNPVGAGARGLGMGGAFIAVADDGTATSFNPAGLAQLRRSELAIVGFGHRLTSTLSIPQFDGTVLTRRSTSSHNAPDFAGLAVPFDAGGRNLTVQLSYQRAVDLFGRGSAQVSDTIAAGDLNLSDADLRLLGLTATRPVDVIAEITPEQSGAFHTASLAAGYQVNGRLMAGASVNYWVAEWSATGDSNTRLVATTRPGTRPIEFFRLDTRFSQEQNMRGLNVAAGFLLRYPKVSVGGVVRLPFAGDYDLAESDVTTTTRVGGVASAPQSFTLEMTSRLHWPRTAGIGLALRPIRGLTVAADYATSHWSRTFIEDVPGGALLTRRETDAEGQPRDSFTDRNFFDLLPASQTATSDTDQFRVGVEYLLSLPRVVIPLRAGGFRDRSPVAEFDAVEGRKITGFTLGTGVNFSRFVVDVAFERRTSEGAVGLRLRRGQPTGVASPAEQVRERRLVASLIYRFGDDDPIKRALRYLFVGSPESRDN